MRLSFKLSVLLIAHRINTNLRTNIQLTVATSNGKIDDTDESSLVTGLIHVIGRREYLKVWCE